MIWVSTAPFKGSFRVASPKWRAELDPAAPLAPPEAAGAPAVVWTDAFSSLLADEARVRCNARRPVLTI
jgi:hypothetical protein